MEDVTPKEIKRVIRYYVSLPYRIQQQKLKQREHQLYAYSKQSFTGTSKYGFTIDDYTHAINIERFVIILIMEQQAIDRALEGLELRYRLFKELLPNLDYPTLKTLGKHSLLTDFECEVYQAIQEINYYIDQHKLAKQRLRADEQVSDLTAEEIENMLDSDNVKTAKMVKVSMLNNVEDELMAMLS